jgi:hypothetical protein
MRIYSHGAMATLSENHRTFLQQVGREISFAVILSMKRGCLLDE